MANTPLISVIIPVYNPGIHFKKCVDSILGQTYHNLEIILVDDGSTDGSENVCDEYARLDHRVSVIHQQNSGVSKARNAGLKIATGDYYHFPDSDDYIELDSYEYLLGLIEEHECDTVNFEHFITYPDREITHSYSDDFYGLCNTRDTLYKLASGVQFCWNKFFSRKLIVQDESSTGIAFNETIARGEDTLFAATALQNGSKVWFDKRPLYHYVQTEESACRGHFRPNQLSVIKLYDAFEPIYGKYPQVWEKFIVFTQEILISLYYDIWSDNQEWKNEKKELLQVIRSHYKEIKERYTTTKKQKFKFAIFNFSPELFCQIHKKIH